MRKLWKLTSKYTKSFSDYTLKYKRARSLNFDLIDQF